MNPNAAVVRVAPDWERPASRSFPWLDAGLAAALVIGMLLAAPLFTFRSEPAAQFWSVLVWALALNAPLVVRRRWPASAATVVTAVFIAGQMIGVPERLFSQISLIVAHYSLAAWSSRRQRARTVQVALTASLVAWMIVGLVGLSNLVSAGAPGLPYGSAVALTVLTNALALAAPFAFGEMSWHGARRLAALRDLTSELMTERERTARQAATLERVRIARELHDVVAHHVSLIGVQAGAARLAGTDPEAGEAFRAIEASAREAVAELRNLLGSLRDEAPTEMDPEPYSTTLTTRRLPRLIDEFRETGHEARLTVTGEGLALTPVVDAALYRIAQEALTNVRKHAPADAEVLVTLHVTADTAVLAITDTSSSPRPAAIDEPGLGQLGMRERMALLGGTVAISSSPTSYEVRCEVPM